MRERFAHAKQATTLAVALSCIALASIGGADRRAGNIADQELFFAPVPKAVCGPGDKPETALQGQVTAAMRVAGFQGSSCNLQLLAQVKGEGANWQSTEWREGKGKNKKVCAYHGTASPSLSGPGRQNLGVRVIDISNPSAPVNTAYLNTSSMLDPWESLKVNQRRRVLGSVNAQNGGINRGPDFSQGGPEIDIYDVSGDCRYPQLLTSTAIVATDGHPIYGHEGNWAPDGLTYYGTDVQYSPGVVPGNNGQYYAIDTVDLTKPKYITSWQTGIPGGGFHGLSVSDDGMRGYFVSTAQVGGANLTDPTFPAGNGLMVYDLTAIQNRIGANPQPKLISSLLWKDGAVAQHTIPILIRGKPYLIHVDEAGSGGFASGAQFATACAAGMPPFPMARIIDMADESKPRIVAKVMLETHDPANCDKVGPDVAGLLSFTYGSHYCSVDNKKRATTLVCGYFNSGIRVFDIRDPVRPREIAYYNPASTALPPGSNHSRAGGWVAGGPDWCAAQSHLDAEQGTLWTICQDNGLLSLRFTHNAWPFAEASTPPGQQN